MSLSRLPAAVRDLLTMHLASNTVSRWQITADGQQSVVSLHCNVADGGGKGHYRPKREKRQGGEKRFKSVLPSNPRPLGKTSLKWRGCKTEMGQTCLLVCAVVVALISLGLNLTALLTDSWYDTTTAASVDPRVRQTYDFHFGLWRLCYKDGVPDYIAGDPAYEKAGSCVHIYQQLIHKQEPQLDSDSRLRLHLSRTVVGCSVASGVLTLASLLGLGCGLCRLCGSASSSSSSSSRPCVYLAASLLLLLATMSGIASGISFIALRDLDNTTVRSSSSSSSSSSSVLPLPPALPDYVSQEYSWSFMLHWIGAGLALVDSFLLLCLLHNSYEFVGEDHSKAWSPYSTF